MSQLVVECPNPSCPRRSVQDQEVVRETWEATWLDGNPEHAPYWHSDIACPACGQEGIDPESGQLDSAEEELGVRCKCGVVSVEDQMIAVEKPPGWPFPVIGRCPHCLKVILAPVGSRK